ncbi:MAG: PhnD/SsuA/transferrin family substrate-binding protein [Pseudomonadota bacterium]
MIASLPMYDRPETFAATDRLWAAIRDQLRARGIDAPNNLTRSGDPWSDWAAPDLVFSQTCGLPFQSRLKGRVTAFAVPDFGLPGCPPGHYYSVIVARPGPMPAQPRLAVNEPLSQSGWANLHTWLMAHDQNWGGVRRTGSHRASAEAVVTGAADLAAIDAQTWRLITTYDAWASQLDVIDRTPPIAGLPYIAPLGADSAAHIAALRSGIAALQDADRAALNLCDAIPVTEDAYADRIAPPAP